jgi:hypothetical protein
MYGLALFQLYKTPCKEGRIFNGLMKIDNLCCVLEGIHEQVESVEIRLELNPEIVGIDHLSYQDIDTITNVNIWW